ncbi:PEP-CTERM putative exosortase interaction domain-containing protein [Opitutaceae bacterium TAV1]|nr:PEP-CTERM putative exosortase interaction domain-containing protein [Opitutaceae bacterium TAV1]
MTTIIPASGRFSPAVRAVPAAFAFVLLASAIAVPAGRADSIWNGPSEGGTWSTDANWTPATAPVSDASTVLEFAHTGSAWTTTNDIAGDFSLNILRFSGNSAGTINIAASAGQKLVFTANGALLPQIQFNSASSADRTIAAQLRLDADTSITSAGANAGNLWLSGTISGSGALVVDYSSSGTVVLNAANSTFSGGVVLNSGRLALNNNTTLGSGDLTLKGGLLRTTGGSDRSLANKLNFAGNVTIFSAAATRNLAFTNGGSLQGSNAIHTVTLDNAANTLTLGGAFTGAGNGLTFAGSGKVALGNGSTDTAANTFTGATAVSASGVTLTLDKADGTDAVAGNLAVSAGSVVWARSNQIADTAGVAVTGGTVRLDSGLTETVASLSLGGGTFAVSGGATLSSGAVAVTAGAGTRSIGGVLETGAGGLSITHDGSASILNALSLYDTATSASGVLRLGGNLTYTNATGVDSGARIIRGAGNGHIDLGGADRIFTINDGAADEDFEITTGIKNGGLTKAGLGTLVLSGGSGSMDYSGATIVDAGRLVLTTSLPSSNVIVRAGGIFAGGGATGGVVGQSLSFDDGGRFAVSLAPSSTTSVLTLKVGGPVTIAAGALLDISSLAGLDALAFDTQLILLENTGTGSIAGSFLGYEEGRIFTLGNNTFLASYQLGAGGNDFGFLVTAVPEPAALAALLGAGILAATAVLRRRKR